MLWIDARSHLCLYGFVSGSNHVRQSALGQTQTRLLGPTERTIGRHIEYRP